MFKSRAKWAGLVAAEIGVAVLLGWMAGPGGEAQYLELQARSDSVHRFVLVAEPLLALGFLLFAMLALIFAQFDLPRRVLHGLWMAALVLGAGVAGYVVRFDLSIERAGLRGQFVVHRPALALDRAAAVLGPYREESNGPGVTSDELGAGGQVVLDRRSLFLRRPDGQLSWQRRRPGGWPAAMLVAGGLLLVALPSDLYDDDILLLALELDGGHPLFEFHALGRSVERLQVSEGRILLGASRPAVSTEYVIDPAGPAVLQAREAAAPAGGGRP